MERPIDEAVAERSDQSSSEADAHTDSTRSPRCPANLVVPVNLDGETAVQVKFDRQTVVETFDVGEQDVLLTGVIDGATFQAETTIELFEPGNSGGGPPNNQGRSRR